MQNAGVALITIGAVWLAVLAFVAIDSRRRVVRADVFASLDSVNFAGGSVGSTSAEDLAEWLQRYALPCYTEQQMLPHVRAWLGERISREGY